VVDAPYRFTSGELVIWDLRGDQAIVHLKPFLHVMHAIEFSPNGKLLAIAGQDWSVRQPDPNVYATLAHKDVVRVLRSDTWQTIGELQGHNDIVTSLEFLEQGRVLVTGSADRTIRLWDLVANDQVAMLTGHQGRVRSLATLPREKKLVSADEHGRIEIWDFSESGIRSQARTPLLEHPFRRIVAISSTTAGLLTCDQLRGATLWDASRHFESGVSFCASSMPFTYASDVSPDGSTLATAGGTFDRLSQPAETVDDPAGGEILLWDIATGKLRNRLSATFSTVFSLKYSPDGKTLASGTTSGDVLLWNVATGEPWPSGRLREHFGAVTAIAFSPDGKMLATGSREGKRVGQPQSGNVRIWDLPDNGETATQPLVSRLTRDGYTRRVVQLAFSPHGDWLFASSESNVDVWGAKDFEKRMSVPGSAFAVSPRGDRFAVAGADKESPTVVWETDKGRELNRFQPDSRSFINSVAFTPDGRQLVVGTYVGQLTAWDLESGVELVELR